MPCLSYLKFPSFTDNACNSLTLDAVSVKKCKVATIIGYRSAISSKHKGWGGRSVSTNGDLSKLIKGIFNKQKSQQHYLQKLKWD
jgi:hypothetical protein